MTANLFPQDILNAVSYSADAVTQAAVTLHVATTGSDTTGNGTAAKPFATPTRAYAALPRTLAHPCKILVGAGSYPLGAWPETINSVFVGNGSLSLVGVGTPSVVSGPHAVTGVAPIGSAGYLRLTVGAGGLGAQDTRCGDFVHVTAGATPDVAYAIAQNSATTLDIGIQVVAPVGGETVYIVRPAVKCTIDKAFICAGAQCVDFGTAALTDDNCRLILHNIWLDGSASPYTNNVVDVTSTSGRYAGSIMDFVRFDGPPASVMGTLLVHDTGINSYGASVADWKTDGATGLTNLGAYGGPGLSVTSNGDREDSDVCCYGDVLITNCYARGELDTVSGSLEATLCTAGSFFIPPRATAELWGLLIVGKVGNAGFDLHGGTVTMDYCHVLRGSNAIRIHDLCQCRIADTSCDPVDVTLSGMEIEALCSIQQHSLLPNLLGATPAKAAFAFMTPAVPVLGTAWLGTSGDTVDDGKGSRITYIA